MNAFDEIYFDETTFDRWPRIVGLAIKLFKRTLTASLFSRAITSLKMKVN